MSTPFSGLLAGMTPGIQNVPMRGPDGRFSGGTFSTSTLVPSVEFSVGPGTSNRPSISFNGMGLPKGAASTTNGFRSNTFVQKEYLINTFRSNHHLHMIQGQFVFLYHETRTLIVDQKKYVTYTAVTLPHLNLILQQAWDQYQTLINQNNSDALEVRRLRAEVPESVLVEYARTREPETTELNAIHEESFQGDTNVQKLYELAIKNEIFALILAPQFVWKRYQFGGPILSLTHGTSTGGDYLSLDSTGRISVLNLVAGDDAEVHDVFGPVEEMQARAKVAFYLTRRKLSNGWGAFVIMPLVCATGALPSSLNTYDYYDPTGCGCNGLIYELGYVKQEPDNVDIQRVHDRAAGVDLQSRDLSNMRAATASCSKIRIALHKNQN